MSNIQEKYSNQANSSKTPIPYPLPNPPRSFPTPPPLNPNPNPLEIFGSPPSPHTGPQPPTMTKRKSTALPLRQANPQYLKSPTNHNLSHNNSQNSYHLYHNASARPGAKVGYSYSKDELHKIDTNLSKRDLGNCSKKNLLGEKCGVSARVNCKIFLGRKKCSLRFSDFSEIARILPTNSPCGFGGFFWEWETPEILRCSAISENFCKRRS